MICDNEQMSSLSTSLFFFLIVHLHNMLIRKNEFVFLDDFKIHIIKKKKRDKYSFVNWKAILLYANDNTLMISQ